MPKHKNTRIYRFFAAALTASLAGLVATSAYASVKNPSTVQNGECGTASASFITLPRTQAKFGFGATNKASQLVNAGSGAAGVVMDIDQSAGKVGSSTGDFQGIESAIKVSASDLDNVIVRYCFITDHGLGSPFAYEQVGVKGLVGKPGDQNWRLFNQTSRDFGGTNVRSMKLDKVSFLISTQSNLTVGDTIIHRYSAADARPHDLNFDTTDCEIFNACSE